MSGLSGKAEQPEKTYTNTQRTGTNNKEEFKINGHLIWVTPNQMFALCLH